MYKSFNSRPVLSAIDITFLRGEISVIIGGSGTGKTTLLRLLIGLEKPDRGSIVISGQDIVPLNDREMNQVRRTRRREREPAAGFGQQISRVPRHTGHRRLS